MYCLEYSPVGELPVVTLVRPSAAREVASASARPASEVELRIKIEAFSRVMGSGDKI